jgi:hypothetical protein
MEYDSRVRQVPPGSSPVRELLHAIAEMLEVAPPATSEHTEDCHQLLLRRAKATREALRSLLVCHDEPADGEVMLWVQRLRDELHDLPVDYPVHQS